MQQVSAKRVKDLTRLGWNNDPLGIVQKKINLTIQTSSICTTQNAFWRMKRTNLR